MRIVDTVKPAAKLMQSLLRKVIFYVSKVLQSWKILQRPLSKWVLIKTLVFSGDDKGSRIMRVTPNVFHRVK